MTLRISGPPRRRGIPRPDKRLLRSRTTRLLREIDCASSELSLGLVLDVEIAKLNESFRREKGPTDVLAFSLLEGEGVEYRGAMLGDVVVGIETAERQARRSRRSLDDELARLVIHGTLHLIGYDHVRDSDARVMRALERRLWRQLRE